MGKINSATFPSAVRTIFFFVIGSGPCFRPIKFKVASEQVLGAYLCGLSQSVRSCVSSTRGPYLGSSISFLDCTENKKEGGGGENLY